MRNRLPSSLNAAAPSGRGPSSTSLPVIAASTGLSSAIRAGSPDTSITPVESSAFCGPMNTGAWRNAMPRSCQRAARSAVPLAAVVV
jgi:hypothetical protein